MSKNWTFAEVWNKGLENKEEREPEPRDYIWASELGKAPVDVYLRMKGVKPTNPPNARSRRKFEAGNVFEWIVKLILTRAGILIDDQKRCEYQYPGLLKVTGKADFIAGGTPDFSKAIAELKAMDVPEFFVRAAEELDAYFKKEFPLGLITKPLEIKSLGAYIFEALLKRGASSKNHRLQLKHYLKSLSFPVGSVVYICRDDMRMMEVAISNDDEQLEKEYYDAIKTISEYYQKNEQPPLEKMIVFDEDMGKFATNYNVAYSGYLTLLYGFKDQAEYDAQFKKEVNRWNSAIKRFKEGKKMTPMNIDAITAMTVAGFDPAKIVAGFVDPSELEAEETDE